MKAIVGAVALLLVLAFGGMVVVKQLKGLAAQRAPAAPDAAAVGVPSTSSRAAEQQVTRQIDAAMQAASVARDRADAP